jgi:type IV pilus assembly protein PilW
MSLVELMVGMLIGLIGIVIISHLYVTNEEYKRRVTSSGGAQSNGAIALYTLERELRQAAFGLNHSRAFQCQCDHISSPGCSPIQYYYDGTYSFPPNPTVIGARFPLALHPVVITDQATGPDSLSIFYGSDNERILGAKLETGMTTAGSNIVLDGTVGFEARDTTLNEPGNLVVLQKDTTCSLVHITGKTTTTLLHDSSSKWNPPGGGLLPGAAFDNVAYVFNLGSRPNWRAYSIKQDPLGNSTGKLQLTDQMRVITAGAVSEDIMDNIFDLQAQYGLDTSTPPDGVVDVWTKCITFPSCPPTAPSNENEWVRAIAVRLAVLARSDELVKPATAGTCDATTTANRPTWSGAVVDATTNPVAAPFTTLDKPGVLPSCYKYRVFETVVPLRNMLWRQ